MGSKKDVDPYLTRIAKLRNGIGATLVSPRNPVQLRNSYEQDSSLPQIKQC